MIIFMFSSVRWPFQCGSKIRFIGGGGGSQLGVPKARAARGGGGPGACSLEKF